MREQVAIQGLRGSFHHEASNHFFDSKQELVECETFQDVAKAVISREADFGLMAIENSLAGCIIPNYNLIRKEQIQIHGEVGLRVKLNLLTNPGVVEDEINEVHSHQMALRQCGSFFDQYPKMKLVESFDTAGSARNIKEKGLTNTAAVAGELAAREYGLNILKKGIEDHDLNYTRFLVIRPKGEQFVSNPNKVSVYFQTSHETGSLAHTLTIISGLGINLSKLQSHPVPSKNSLYGFFATLEIDEISQLDDLTVIMKRMALRFEILGIYKKGETHG